MPEHTPNLLSFSHVFFSYHTPQGEIPAIKDLSFSVSKGSFVSIVGPSGCGKTTLLSLISGLLTPEAGEIKKNCETLGYMLQRDELFEWRTIEQNARLGLEIAHKKDAAHMALLEHYLKQYGLYPFRDRRPSELSGGMRQRAALIRTLVLQPDLLLLDEPFSALDYQTRLAVCDDVTHIIRKEKKTALLVTHDLSEAISVGDVVYVLSSRPATLRRRVPIAFSAPDLTPFARREQPEFQQYFQQIWSDFKSREDVLSIQSLTNPCLPPVFPRIFRRKERPHV